MINPPSIESANVAFRISKELLLNFPLIGDFKELLGARVELAFERLHFLLNRPNLILESVGDLVRLPHLLLVEDGPGRRLLRGLRQRQHLLLDRVHLETELEID